MPTFSLSVQKPILSFVLSMSSISPFYGIIITHTHTQSCSTPHPKQHTSLDLKSQIPHPVPTHSLPTFQFQSALLSPGPHLSFFLELTALRLSFLLSDSPGYSRLLPSYQTSGSVPVSCDFPATRAQALMLPIFKHFFFPLVFWSISFLVFLLPH